MTDTAFNKLCREMRRQARTFGQLTPELKRLWPACPLPHCPYKAAVHLGMRLCFPHSVYYTGGVLDTISGPLPLIPYPVPIYLHVN